MAELLPCPFCGSSVSIEQRGDPRMSTIYQCDNCGCRLETGEERDYGAEWNRRAPFPETKMVARWLPIAQADRTINHVTEFTAIGLTLKNSDTFWVRDEDGRVYRAAWSEGNKGRDYWWDWESESPVDPVEFMPHPLDPRWATTEGQP